MKGRYLLLALLLAALYVQPTEAAERKGSGLVRFRDAEALSDRAIVELNGVTAPPAGSHYQGWLGSDDGRWLGIGAIPLNARGSGKLEWTSPTGENLIASYSRFIVTVEGDGATNAWPTPSVAYAGAVAPEVLGPWRALTVAGPDTPLPSRPGLAVGLKEETKDLYDDTRSARNAMRDAQRGRARSMDEEIINRLVGVNSGSYGDWDGDGKVETSGDTYGIDRYLTTIQQTIQPVLANTSLPEDHLERATYLKNATDALLLMSNQTHNLLNVLTPNVDTANGLIVQRDVVWLSKLMVDGADLNGDGDIEASQTEIGARGIYTTAQDLGRMRLQPVE